MKIKLSKVTDIPENNSIATIFSESSRFPFQLMPEELALWKRRPEKTNTLLIQRLPDFLFLVHPDMEKQENSILEACRKAGASWMEIIRKEKIEGTVVVGMTESAHTAAFLEGCLLAGYSFQKYKREKEDIYPSRIFIMDPGLSDETLMDLEIVTDAVFWARDMVNEPLSSLNATQFAEEISRIGEDSGFSVDIFHKQKIEALKMGGLLAVNLGSPDPPTFTVMEWNPVNSINQHPVILIGKGIVFDTGGLSLKPTLKSMDFMKSDMAGAAAAAAAIYAAAKAHLPVHLVGLVPATDNRPDGNALTPGDIITISDGTTVEVLNTDAEGRLILADALCYAKRFDPLLVIDMATLSGAVSIISGIHGIIALSNNPEYLKQLTDCGESVYERIIELPLWEEFATSLKSDIADFTNTGGRDGQTIIAAKFLEHFTGYPWIHLDIAGTAFIFEKDGYRSKGATGSSVRLLFNFLKKFK